MQRWRSLLFSYCFVTNIATQRTWTTARESEQQPSQAAAANAHFATRFCGLSPANLSAYKARVRARLGEPNRFESDWTKAGRVSKRR